MAAAADPHQLSSKVQQVVGKGRLISQGDA